MDEQTPFQQEPFASSFQPEIFPPWENPNRPAFERWWETVKGVFAAPSDFFSRMNTGGGLGSPLAFGVIGGSIGGIIGQIFGLLFQLVGFSLLAFLPAEARSQATTQATGQFIGGIFTIFLAPIIILIGLFIGSGITHLFLILVGGARKNYETTFRVNAYISGSIGLLCAIPLCGNLIYMVWYIIAEIIGLAKAHETTVGKAAFAVLLPFGLICTCCALVFGGIFGAAFFAALAQQHR